MKSNLANLYSEEYAYFIISSFLLYLNFVICLIVYILVVSNLGYIYIIDIKKHDMNFKIA